MSHSTASLASLDGASLSRMYASGDTTPSEVAEAVIARLEDREPELNAMFLFDADEVRADAAASTERWRGGTQQSPYDGVPVTVKENIARAGKPKPSGTAIPNPPVPS